MKKTMLRGIASVLLLGSVGIAAAAVPAGQHQVTIFVDDKEAGSAQFKRRLTEEGRVDALRSDVSVKLLGFEVFEFTQEVEQVWEDGELIRLTGWTDDDGDVFETDLARENGALVGTLNGDPIELPAGAFPTSVWNYEITENPILFDVKDLEIRHVEVERSEEVLEIDGRRIRTERFDFVDGWDATIWYDDQRRLVQFVYGEASHEVRIVPERCPETMIADAGAVNAVC